jgi:hypothetical protein
VKEFGKIRDADEVARRELIWDQAIAAIEMDSGHEAASVGPEEFRDLLEAEVEVRTFRPRQRPSRPTEIEEGA